KLRPGVSFRLFIPRRDVVTQRQNRLSFVEEVVLENQGRSASSPWKGLTDLAQRIHPRHRASSALLRTWLRQRRSPAIRSRALNLSLETPRGAFRRGFVNERIAQLNRRRENPSAIDALLCIYNYLFRPIKEPS